MEDEKIPEGLQRAINETCENIERALKQEGRSKPRAKFRKRQELAETRNKLVALSGDAVKRLTSGQIGMAPATQQQLDMLAKHKHSAQIIKHGLVKHPEQ